jgi:hypothetical protein
MTYGFGLAYIKREGYPDLNYIDMHYKGGVEGFVNDLWDELKKLEEKSKLKSKFSIT